MGPWLQNSLQYNVQLTTVQNETSDLKILLLQSMSTMLDHWLMSHHIKCNLVILHVCPRTSTLAVDFSSHIQMPRALNHTAAMSKPTGVMHMPYTVDQWPLPSISVALHNVCPWRQGWRELGPQLVVYVLAIGHPVSPSMYNAKPSRQVKSW